MKSVLYALGFDTIPAFYDSVFHPKSLLLTISVSSVFGWLASAFEYTVGFQPIVGLVIFVLFILEFVTGIKASKKEKKPITSRKFSSGFIKLGIYIILTGCVNLLAKKMEVKPILGFDFNHFELIHYTFVNFIIVQYLISNLENFNRLGWGDTLPLIRKISKLLNLSGAETDKTK